MGLADFLAPALTTATQAAGAYQGAEAQAATQKRDAVIQSLIFARQQRQAEIENALKQAQTTEATNKAQTYSPEYAGQKAGAEAAATQPFKLDAMHQELNNRLQELQASGANAMQVAQARIQGEKDIASANIQAAASRQAGQQQFLAGQQGRQQQFQQGQQAREQQFQTGHQGREIQGNLQKIQQTQSGQIFPNVENVLGFGPLAHPVSAAQPVAQAAQPSSTAPRETIHPTEYQALKAAGYSDDQIASQYEVSP